MLRHQHAANQLQHLAANQHQHLAVNQLQHLAVAVVKSLAKKLSLAKFPLKQLQLKLYLKFRLLNKFSRVC